MSLETQLAENTAALKALAAMLAKFSMPESPLSAERTAEATKAAASAAAKEVPPAPKPVPTPPVAETKAAQTESVTESPSEAVTYELVVKHINKAITGGQRDKVIDALKAFGVKKGPELKPEQWADFIKAIA